MEELLTYSFFQNALLASLFSGICCAIVGTYMVTRRLLFLGGGITHSSLGGIGLAYWAGFNPTLGALIFAIASAFGIDYLSSPANKARQNRISEDSATNIIWSAGMAVGVIFIFLTPGYAPNLMNILFGNLLLVSTSQVISLFAFDILLIIIMLLFGRAIIYAAADSSYASSQRVPVRLINVVMLILLSVAIVLNIRILGIMLMISMLTIPVLVARMYTYNYTKIVAISSLVATISAICGLVFSYLYDIPSSATSVITLVIMLFISYLIKLAFRNILLRR